MGTNLIPDPPIVPGSQGNSAVVNTALDQLDAAIGNRALLPLGTQDLVTAVGSEAGIRAAADGIIQGQVGSLAALNTVTHASTVAAINETLTYFALTGGGGATTHLTTAAAAGATSLVVLSSAGFQAGGYAEYLLSSGALEVNTISAVPDSTHLTLTTPTAASVLLNAIVNATPISIFLAAQAIPHLAGSTLTLPNTVKYANRAVLSVLAYGADPGGTVDSTAAIQACIDAAVGGSNNGSSYTTRFPQGAVYFPPGHYLISSTLNIKSVQGFHMYGVRSQSILICNATNMGNMLNIDGACWTVFEGLEFQGNGGTTSCTNAIHLVWSGAGIARTSTNNTFRDIQIFALKWSNAAIHTDGHNQCDMTLVQEVYITGGWVAGDNTNWAYGVRFGDGVTGNNLTNLCIRLSVLQTQKALCWDGSTGSILGGNLQQNLIDLYNSGPQGQVLIQGVRSEGSQYFYQSPYNSVEGNVVIEACDFSAMQLPNTGGFGNWIQAAAGGTIRLSNVVCYDTPFSGAVSRVAFGVVTGSHVTASIDGLSQFAPLSTGVLALTPGVTLSVSNYTQINSSNYVPTAWWPGLYVTGGQIVAIQATTVATATTVLDWNTSNVQRISMAASITTLTLNNPQAGGRYTILVEQTALGAQTIAWPATLRWAGGAAPTLTTNANRSDVVSLIWEGSVYFASITQNHF